MFKLKTVCSFQIPSVSGQDGGNYTCSPQNILSDTVMVNIMEVMITINKNNKTQYFRLKLCDPYFNALIAL